MMMKKALYLFLIGAALMLAACGGGASPAPTEETPASGAAIPTTAAAVPARPVIRLSADGALHEGLPGAYCWLQAPNDIRCEPDPLDPQPETAVPVQTGQTITFAVESEAGPPAAFYATFLDDLDADGDPLLVDFGGTSSADYTVNLAAGTHRVSVVAEFPDVSGDNSFVSNIFALDVAAGVAANLTPRPTATTAPPLAATEEIALPTTAVTEEPTKDITATEELPDAAADLAATATAIAAGVQEVAATDEVPDLAATATAILTGATETADANALQATSAAATQVAAAEVPLPTQPPTTAPVLPGPTATLPLSVDLSEWPPSVLVVNGGRQFRPAGLHYCYNAADGQEICVDQPVSPSAEHIQINSGDTIRIDAAGVGPLSLSVILASTDLSQQFQRTDLPGSPISLQTFSGSPGNYVLAVETTWPQGRATYYFRLQIVG